MATEEKLVLLDSNLLLRGRGVMRRRSREKKKKIKNETFIKKKKGHSKLAKDFFAKKETFCQFVMYASEERDKNR